MLRSVCRLMTSAASLSIVVIVAAGAFGIGSADAAPVKYVKVCSLYGAGFYYIPGTYTCVKIYAGVEGGWGSSNTNFNVTPGFNVSGTGGVWGVNGGAQFGIPGTPISIGPQVSYFGGNMSGSTFYPTSGFTYSTSTRSIVTAEGTAKFHWEKWFPPTKWNVTDDTFFLPLNALYLSFSAGAASVKTDVTGTNGGFTVSDSSTRTGFTAAVGFELPITNTPLSLTAQFRYINLPTTNINIPGVVPIDRNLYISTIGLQWAFGGPLAAAPR